MKSVTPPQQQQQFAACQPKGLGKRGRSKAIDDASPDAHVQRIPMFSPEAQGAPLRPLDTARVREGARKAQRHMAKSQEASSFEACSDFYLHIELLNGVLYVSHPQSQTAINSPQFWQAVLSAMRPEQQGSGRRGANLRRFVEEKGYQSTVSAISNAATHMGLEASLVNKALPEPQLEPKGYRLDRTSHAGYVEKLDVLEVALQRKPGTIFAHQEPPQQQQHPFTLLVHQPQAAINAPESLPLAFTHTYQQHDGMPDQPIYAFAPGMIGTCSAPEQFEAREAPVANRNDGASIYFEWLTVATVRCMEYGLHSYDVSEECYMPLAESLEVFVCVR